MKSFCVVSDNELPIFYKLFFRNYTRKSHGRKMSTKFAAASLWTYNHDSSKVHQAKDNLLLDIFMIFVK